MTIKERFLEILNSAINENKDDSKIISKYEKIAKNILNEKNYFINDIDILRELFIKEEIDEEEKNLLYQFIFKYNQKVYDYRIGNCNIKALGQENVSKLKRVFKKYGYQFDKLAPFLQEEIVEEANFKCVGEVFEALSDNGYHLTDNKWSYLLTCLLIYSDNRTINRISSLAFSKGLTSDEVLKIGSIFINKTRSLQEDLHERFHIVDTSSKRLLVASSALDFEKNIKTLSTWGFSVRYIYDRLPEVLICSNEILSHNLELFQHYGFSIRSRSNKVCYDRLSALLKYNLEEVIDQFIEVHPLGCTYLRKNLSVLREIHSKDDLLFYKLYYSNKYIGSEEAFIKIINHKESLYAMQGSVSGLSIYMDSYQNINDFNKYEVTNTFIPTYRIHYHSLIQNKISMDIDASIFDNSYIQYINQYSDPKEPLLYNFDGILISKMKVLRIVNAFIKAGVFIDDESFLYALLYNSIVSRDDFNKIRNMISLESQVV